MVMNILDSSKCSALVSDVQGPDNTISDLETALGYQMAEPSVQTFTQKWQT